MWFAGSHSDIGGGYPADDQGLLASDSALEWMVEQARNAGLDIEEHLPAGINPSARARLHNSRRHVFRFARPLIRNLKPDGFETAIHPSVAERWRMDPDYRPPNLKQIGFAP